MNQETVKTKSDEELGKELAEMCGWLVTEHHPRILGDEDINPLLFGKPTDVLCKSLDAINEIEEIVIQKLRDSGVKTGEATLHRKIEKTADENWLGVYRASARFRAEGCYLALVALKEKEND